MVHLEIQYEYLKKIGQSSEISPLIDFIINERKAIILKNNNSNAFSVAHDLFICVYKNDKNTAIEIYNSFSKRHPTHETPWVYNEFVLFSLICAIAKFNFDKKWVSSVLDLQGQSTDAERRIILSSFKNILAGNLNVKEDFHQISLIFQHYSGVKNFQQDRIDKMFKNLWLKEFPFHQSDFLNVISLKAIQIAFDSKGLLSPQEFQDSKVFVSRFKRRTEISGKVIVWLFVISIFVALVLMSWRFYNTEGEKSIFAKVINFTTGILGVGLITIFSIRKRVENLVIKFIRAAFGYKEVIKKISNKVE